MSTALVAMSWTTVVTSPLASNLIVASSSSDAVMGVTASMVAMLEVAPVDLTGLSVRGHQRCERGEGTSEGPNYKYNPVPSESRRFAATACTSRSRKMM
jgi:hypothetical protein